MLIAFSHTFCTVVFFKLNNEESGCLKMGEFLPGRNIWNVGIFHVCNNVYKITDNQNFKLLMYIQHILTMNIFSIFLISE
jgi:hypothetical protein